MGIVKNIAYAISDKSFLPFFKHQPVFPYYHIVKDEKVAHIKYLYHYKNVAQFKHDIKFLKTYYRPVEFEDIGNGNIPSNSFMITFDDGLEEIYSVIFPILKQENLKAIFFINPNFVDNEDSLYKHDISIIIDRLKKDAFPSEIVNRIAEIFSISYTSADDFTESFKNVKFSDRKKIALVMKLLDIDMKAWLKKHKPYVSKEQIREMIDAGYYFGGHTMSHPPLGQLSFEEQKSEIINSIEWLKSNFGINYSAFAFPFTDANISLKMMRELCLYDKNILIFGNSGLKRDINKRIIQRFSLENPSRKIERVLVAENLYKFFNKLIGKYQINRK